MPDIVVEEVMKRTDQLYAELVDEYNASGHDARAKLLVRKTYVPLPGGGEIADRLRMRAFCQAMVEALQPRPEPGSRFVVEYESE